MTKRCILIILVIIALLFLSSLLAGCRDSSEVDDNVYVTAIGLDKGANNKVIVTIQYPVYSSQKGDTGGGSSSGGRSNIHSVESPSLLEGIDLMNMSISRRISLLHTKMLIISEDFAREGIGDFLAPLSRFRGVRRTMSVAVSKGSAMEFIQENKTYIGESITKSMELMLAQSKNTGFFPQINFFEFYRDITSNYGNAVAIYAGVNKSTKLEIGSGKKEAPFVIERDVKPGELPRLGTGKSEFVGSALFLGDKMVGSLNPYETRYMLMLRGKFNKGIMTIEDKKAPGKGIILSIRNGRPVKIHGRFEDGRPIIDIDLNIEADIGAIHSRINYENSKLIEDLNEQLKEEIQEGMKKTIDKTKKEYKTDPFEFGKKFAGYFKTIQEWENYKWPSHYPETKVNINVEVNVRRTGLTIDSTPIVGEPKP
jgi:spore germination protein KC